MKPGEMCVDENLAEQNRGNISLLECLEVLPMHQLLFEGGKGTFNNCTSPRVT